MAMEGTLKSRNGKLYVLYTSDEYSAPFRQFLWWRVLEIHGSGYGERPEAGDVATSSGGGEWRTRNPSTHRSTGTVSTGTGSTQAETVERASIKPPPAGGKELRWHYGRWEKLMAKGWMPAGEGKAKTSKKPSTNHSIAKRHYATKAPAQLQREIDEVLAQPQARAHATMKNARVGSRKLAVKEINDIVRADDGFDVFMIRHFAGADTALRVCRARKSRIFLPKTEVLICSTGRWITLGPDDRVEVRPTHGKLLFSPHEH